MKGAIAAICYGERIDPTAGEDDLAVVVLALEFPAQFKARRDSCTRERLRLSAGVWLVRANYEA
jgi:hypothetical protein